MIRRSLPVLVTLAAALEFTALAAVMAINRIEWLVIALLLHLLAARCAVRAAHVRREDLTRTERDAVNWLALLVPMFGPVLAWWVPKPTAQESEEEESAEVINAHEMFERYEEHVKPHRPDYERTLFTGNYARDLARELDAESYFEVLRHGNTNQKRNALRRLATLGEPKHFALIRGCLLEPSHEVRLYAYAELERSSRVYEDEIAELSRQLARRPKRIEALLAMARVQFRYAASGIHDDSMAAFYFKTVIAFAQRAMDAGAQGPEPIWLVARALARRGDTDEAMEAIASLPAEDQEMEESCLVRAAIHFEARDYESARVEADRIEAVGGDVPGWLHALRVEVTT
ncbi:MAG: tetratricopeptide repeat protein [Planctomycetota bacterium]|jgi:hypothetical protein